VPTAADLVQINTITPNATVIAGGSAVVAGSDIGNFAGSQGAVLVTGASASWTNLGLLSVGTSGTGTLTIANGGVVSNGGASGFIAYTNNSQGSVMVTGPGSTWNISPTVPNGGLRVGGSSLDSGFLPPGPGTGTLTVANGGTVNVIGGAQTVFVAEPAGSTGTVNIGAASVAAAVAPGFINAANLLFGAGAASLNFNHTATDYVFAPVIGGNGAVNVISGRTILTASNTYTGPTTVNGGALIVSGSIASSALTTVNGGGLLGGVRVVGNTPRSTLAALSRQAHSWRSDARWHRPGQLLGGQLCREPLHHFDSRRRAYRQRSDALTTPDLTSPHELELYRQYHSPQADRAACSSPDTAHAAGATPAVFTVATDLHRQAAQRRQRDRQLLQHWTAECMHLPRRQLERQLIGRALLAVPWILWLVANRDKRRSALS